MTDTTKMDFQKSSVLVVNSNFLDSCLVDSSDLPIGSDPNRRSSLGGESLLEHDINDEGGYGDDCTDPLLSEASLGVVYADDIFMVNRCKEKLYHPIKCIEEQPQITEYMRCTLINWLVKVNHELRFGPETIFIAVSLTDRFLATTPIAQDCLQLLAVCALCIAAKLEETTDPSISVLVSLCGFTYKHHHFRRMEALLLSTVQFRLHSPTSWSFVTYMAVKSSRLSPLDRRSLALARYIVELSLGNYQISQYFPSEQAAASLVLACLVTNAPDIVYPPLLQEPSTGNLELGQETNIVDTLSNINLSCQSLLWIFLNVFSSEEMKQIGNCVHDMKEYMKPFLSSNGSGLPLQSPSTTFPTKTAVAAQEKPNFAQSGNAKGDLHCPYSRPTDVVNDG